MHPSQYNGRGNGGNNNIRQLHSEPNEIYPKTKRVGIPGMSEKTIPERRDKKVPEKQGSLTDDLQDEISPGHKITYEPVVEKEKLVFERNKSRLYSYVVEEGGKEVVRNYYF